MTESGQRLDIWLWRVRLFKVRADATRFVEAGKVRITRFGQTERTSKAHFRVSPGDVVSLVKGHVLLQLEVLSLPDRRGPASEAQEHYRRAGEETAA